MKKGKKLYAVILGDTGDLADYIEADSADEAFESFLATLPEADAEHHREEGAHAIEAERVLDGIRVPGYLLSAIEYGPEFAGIEPGTEEYREYRERAKALEGLNIIDWVRVNSVWDEWVPVIDPR